MARLLAKHLDFYWDLLKGIWMGERMEQCLAEQMARLLVKHLDRYWDLLKGIWMGEQMEQYLVMSKV